VVTIRSLCSGATWHAVVKLRGEDLLC